MNPLIRFKQSRGITQGELADMLGMPQSQVSRLSNGRRRPSLETMIRVERITGIPLDEWADWAKAAEQEAEANP
jgi:transcriptional regulator with XRE-family HTH domain